MLPNRPVTPVRRKFPLGTTYGTTAPDLVGPAQASLPAVN